MEEQILIPCNICKKGKLLEEFYRKKDGTPNSKVCKTCRKEEAKKRYHDKGGIETLRKWRESNWERYKDQVNRGQEKRKQRMKIDPVYHEKLKREKRENSKKNYISTMLGRARKRAIKYNVPFTITVEDIQIPEKCPLLDVPFQLGVKGNYPFSPSIDRLDSTKGYTPNNVQVISTLANTMKNNATKQQLLTFAKNIVTYVQNMI
jgi:hypothetical protein